MINNLTLKHKIERRYKKHEKKTNNEFAYGLDVNNEC